MATFRSTIHTLILGKWEFKAGHLRIESAEEADAFRGLVEQQPPILRSKIVEIPENVPEARPVARSTAVTGSLTTQALEGQTEKSPLGSTPQDAVLASMVQATKLAK